MVDIKEEQRNNFILEVRSAIKRNQVVVMILYNAEEDKYAVFSNGYDANFDDIIKAFHWIYLSSGKITLMTLL